MEKKLMQSHINLLKYILSFLLINIFFTLMCISQEKDRCAELTSLEMQLVLIQDTLSAYANKNPYKYEEQEELYNAFESYRNSLQNSFYSILKQICSIDTAMNYAFTDLSKYVTIVNSPDGKMRIFSRDTYAGGSIPYLCSYIQYTFEDSAFFEYLPELYSENEYIFDNSESMGLNYDIVYLFQDAEKIYYLLAGESSLAATVNICVLRAISIDADGIKNELIFKVDSDTINYLSVSYMTYNEFSYDQPMYIGDSLFPRIVFDTYNQVVLKPEVSYSKECTSGQLTGEVTSYKWRNNVFSQ